MIIILNHILGQTTIVFYPAYVSDPDGLQFNIHLNESSEVDKHALSEEP